MLKLIDTDVVTFEMEQAYMLNRGARKCIREILLKAPEVDLADKVILNEQSSLVQALKECAIYGDERIRSIVQGVLR